MHIPEHNTPQIPALASPSIGAFNLRWPFTDPRQANRPPRPDIPGLRPELGVPPPDTTFPSDLSDVARKRMAESGFHDRYPPRLPSLYGLDPTRKMDWHHWLVQNTPFGSREIGNLMGGELGVDLPIGATDFLPFTGTASAVADMERFDKHPVATTAAVFGSLIPGLGGVLKGAAGQAPLWRSKLTNAVENWGGRDANLSASASDWSNIINNKLPGVKKAEIERSGVNDWLQFQTEKNANRGGSPIIPRAEVVDFLRGDEIQVREVQYGKPVANPDSKYALPEVIRAGERAGSMEDLELTIANDEKVYNALKRRFPNLDEIDDWAGVVAQDVFGGDTKTFQTSVTLSPRHSDPRWQLPGGENYKEIALTLAPRGSKTFFGYHEDTRPRTSEEGGFASPHGYPEDTIAHIRFNERMVDGKRVLHIEEFQSDWNKAGREEGWRPRITPEIQAKLDRLEEIRALLKSEWHPRHDMLASGGGGPLLQERKALAQELEPYLEGIPDMPYKGAGWHELAFRRMLRYAADNNFERMTWVTGKQTQGRYRLVKEIDNIEWQSSAAGKQVIIDTTEGEGAAFRVDPDGKITGSDTLGALTPRHYVGKRLDEILGEGFAAKIMADADGTMPGAGMEIGGEWAVNLYDAAIPQYAKDYGKKWGAEVGMLNLPTQWPRGGLVGRVHYIDITPKMRDALLSEPQAVRGIAAIPAAGLMSQDDQEEPVPPDIPQNIGRPRFRGQPQIAAFR